MILLIKYIVKVKWYNIEYLLYSIHINTMTIFKIQNKLPTLNVGYLLYECYHNNNLRIYSLTF